MTRYRYCLLFVVLALGSVTAAQQSSLRITAPKDGAMVPNRPVVSGEVTGKAASIWVVIHPTGTGDYWIQPPVSDIQAGKWSTRVFIGRPGRIDVDKKFEIRAVADPAVQLEEGMVLEAWPKARLVSPVLHVTRGD